jgi:hypothetical protein
VASRVDPITTEIVTCAVTKSCDDHPMPSKKPQRTLWEKTSLAVAGGATWTVIQLYPPPGPANRYLAYWVVLPLAWLFALLCQREVRSALASAFERFQPTGRVMVGGSAVAIFIAYTVLVVTRMPVPITRVPIREGIGSIGTATPDIVILPDTPLSDRPTRKREEQKADTASQPSNEAQAQPANRLPNLPAEPSNLRLSQ